MDLPVNIVTCEEDLLCMEVEVEQDMLITIKSNIFHLNVQDSR